LNQPDSLKFPLTVTESKMSEVSKITRETLDIKALKAKYRNGTGSLNGQAQMGVEIETWFMQTNPTDVRMMSPAQSQSLLCALADADSTSERWYEQAGQRTAAPGKGNSLVCVNSQGISYQLELCGVLEAATRPVLANEPAPLFNLIQTAQRDMATQASRLGLWRYPAAIPGSIIVADCEANMVQRERLQAEWAKFKSQGPDNPGLRTMGLAASAQLNVSYNGPEEAYEIKALATLLSPILYAACSNSTGFLEGNRNKQANPRANWWLRHNASAPRGGFPAAVFEGVMTGDRTGITDRWIDYVRQVPMVYYYDEQQKPQFGASPTFNQLAAQGNGTAANFALAESLVWPDVKLIGSQRIELRMPDSGWWQPSALGVLGAAIMTKPEARRALMTELYEVSRLSPDDLLVSRLQVGNIGKAAPYGRKNIGDMFGVLAAFLPSETVRMACDAGTRFTEVLRTGVTDSDILCRQLKSCKTAKEADLRLAYL
jgi:hypothetical protein